MLILIHLYPSLFHPCLLAYKQPIPYFFFPFGASVSTSIPHFDISGATWSNLRLIIVLRCLSKFCWFSKTLLPKRFPMLPVQLCMKCVSFSHNQFPLNRSWNPAVSHDAKCKFFLINFLLWSVLCPADSHVMFRSFSCPPQLAQPHFRAQLPAHMPQHCICSLLFQKVWAVASFAWVSPSFQSSCWSSLCLGAGRHSGSHGTKQF